jgi:aminoglycoside phosphotransferase (APT) family kinase protein
MGDDDIVSALLAYLRASTGCPELAYAEAPARMTGGFDAIIMRFALSGGPASLQAPLVLRLMRTRADPERVAQEAAVQNALADLGFPAPRVLVTETRSEALGGPFLIMQRVPGRPLGSDFEGLNTGLSFARVLDILRRLPGIRREVQRLWDEAQVRLRAVPAAEFSAHLEAAGVPARTLSFEANFERMRETVRDLALSGVQPAIDWLQQKRPPPGALAVCHGDLQPFNVLAEDGRLTGVIDWANATIADPAFDYGAMLATLASVPIRVPPGLGWPLRALMNDLARTHARDLGSHPASKGALDYFQVYNCMAQLMGVCRSRARGDTTTGAFNSAAGLLNLTRRVNRLTGLRISPPA